MSEVSSISEPSLYQATTTREINQDLDKDAFIQLLVTQLQYQDPLDPMDNQEMMAQMAQFSALEQMMNVASAVEKQVAHGLIGKYVEYNYENPDTAQTESLVGKVDYIKMSGSTITVGIGDNEVTMDNIVTVVDSTNMQTNSSAFELIGKTVQASISSTGSSTNDTIIEGEVLGVNLKNSEPYVVIGTGQYTVEIALDKVNNIVSSPTLTNKYITATITDEDGNEVEVTGKAEYIKMQQDATYVYIINDKTGEGQFILFEDVNTVKPL
jgi:flagellar basal-body rod modification protein FlgD